MTPEFVYFLKVNAGIALFYAFYRFFFYKDTFFQWRRTALLCFLGISLLYPLLNLQEWIKAHEPMVAMADLYAMTVWPELIVTSGVTAESQIDWFSTLCSSFLTLYWAGVALLLLRFAVQFVSILRLHIRCRVEDVQGVRVHLLKKESGPFSFFGWIFLYPDSHVNGEISEILTHELAHVRQWHSVDVVFSELMCVVCWFNPFAWLVKHEIRNNLEYMADNLVIRTGHDYKTYQYHLLGLVHHKAAATLYNNFNVLPLKKRITMMNKKRTREIGRTKYLMFLPLAALLMIISNIEAVARSTKNMAKEAMTGMRNEVAPQEPDGGAIQPSGDDEIFDVVEQMPQYPGGMQELIGFLTKNIRYPAIAHEKGITGRVIVSFVVEKDGSITNMSVLRSVDPYLDAEAIRVLSAMPRWIPGRQRDKEVRVRYTVPVAFNLEDSPKEEVKESRLPEIVVVGYASDEASLDPGEVFEKVEEMPKFPGGTNGLMNYLARNIKYPIDAQQSNTQGPVIVQMTVDKEGRIVHPKIVRGVSATLDAEAIRVVSLMPRWEPGRQKGKAVSVEYTIPIMFRLQ